MAPFKGSSEDSGEQVGGLTDVNWSMTLSLMDISVFPSQGNADC